MTTPNGALRQLIEDHHDQAEGAHSRLRKDLDGIGGKVSDLQTQYTNLLLRVTSLERTPINVEKVTFSSVQLVVIVGACLSIAVGMWNLRTGINEVQAAVVNAAKVQDDRTSAQEKQMGELKAELQLRRIEIQNLSNKLSDFMLQKGH